jgi:hypothetical protein
MAGGITGRAPVASTIWSAVSRVPSSRASSRGPVNRARCSISVTMPDSALARRPAAETLSVLPTARSLMEGQSTAVTVASMPNSAACRTCAATSAV